MKGEIRLKILAQFTQSSCVFISTCILMQIITQWLHVHIVHAEILRFAVDIRNSCECYFPSDWQMGRKSERAKERREERDVGERQPQSPDGGS